MKKFGIKYTESASIAFSYGLRVCIGFLFFVLQQNRSFAQIYPVQISTQLIPPYSAYLPDYADPSNEKMKLILQFNDFSQAQYSVKLRFEIKGNGFTLKTKSFYNPAPINLIPGQPLLFTSVDLAPYLNSSNLDFIGINQSQYEQKMALPEGYYSICVKACDYNNPQAIQVSNEACVQAWFTLSDPPYLNFPICNTTVKPLTPQNILFQWTPMNLGSPNSGTGTEYEFSLWEFRPDTNANPNQVVQSTRPIFSTVTDQTFFNYGIAEPNLNLYMKYIWRVRAKDKSGRDLFKNNGNSQICTFRYGTLQNVIGDALKINLNAHSLNHRAGQCYWTKQSAFTNYILQVRKLGTQNWFEYENVTGIEKIMNLEAGTKYESRVKGEGNGVNSEWSNVAVFQTEDEPEYKCNDQRPAYNTALPQPLAIEKALPGLIIQSGQFDVTCSRLQSTGEPGWFKGEGYVKVFGKRIRVEWDRIYLDADARQQQGEIAAVTDGIEKWLEHWDIENAEQNAIYTNGKIDTLYTIGNKICYVFQGSEEEICVPTNTNSNVTVIRDGEGNEYQIRTVPPPPKVTGPLNYLTYSSDSLEASDSIKVVFEASAGQNFGFDKKVYASFIKNYEVIKLKNGKNYFVSNKSIGEGANDEVYAVITVPNNNNGAVSFKTKNGTALSVSAGPNANTAKLNGIPDGAECIYAYYNNKKVGKLNVFSLKAETKKLVLVPVNGASVPQNLAAGLNNIYKQCNTNWTITTAPNFTFDLKDGKMESASTTLLSKYSAEMKELRNAYKEKDTAYDVTAHYLFVVPAFTDPEQGGYMARGKAMGFIKQGAEVKTFAHELGHGAFAFEHTFPGAEKRSTDNLMDYGSGVGMVLVQWRKTKLPPENFNWFDSDEDGSMLGNDREAEDVFMLLSKIKIAYKKRTKISTGSLGGFAGKAKNCFLGGTHYDYINLQIVNFSKKEINPQNKIIADKAIIEMYGKPVDVVNVDDIIKISVPPVRIHHILAYLKDTSTFKNLLVFVNGYRPIVNFDDGRLTENQLEYTDTENKCELGDCRGYWKGLDARFVNRIGTKNVVYFDGHHTVSTSNHGSVQKYLAGNLASDKIRLYIDPKEGSPGYAIYSQQNDYLHTIPNISGFNIRKNSGELGAQNLIKKINSGEVIFNKEIDSVDIVAHSMGYAYAVGLITELKKSNIKFGRFYILAPENACGGGVPLNWFNEVWQYGSNLGMENAGKIDPPWLQDGVAPQCDVPLISRSNSGVKNGRVAIPNTVITKGYLGSHSVGNYYWIFSERSPGMSGYIKPR